MIVYERVAESCSRLYVDLLIVSLSSVSSVSELSASANGVKESLILTRR